MIMQKTLTPSKTLKRPSLGATNNQDPHTLTAYIYTRGAEGEGSEIKSMAELEASYIASMRRVYVITLRALPGNWRTPPIIRLRAFLKRAKRDWGFQAINIREES
jgi:hypothetical protein